MPRSHSGSLSGLSVGQTIGDLIDHNFIEQRLDQIDFRVTVAADIDRQRQIGAVNEVHQLGP